MGSQPSRPMADDGRKKLIDPFAKLAMGLNVPNKVLSLPGSPAKPKR